MTARRRLPNRRQAETFELEAGGLRYVCTIGRFADGTLAEVLTRTARSTPNCVSPSRFEFPRC
jgi:hypothetical protein